MKNITPMSLPEETTIKKLRKMIPSFQCKKGCTDCCGFTPWTKWEWEQIPDALKTKTNELKCPYATKNGCMVYEHRPIICRMFGTVEQMKCPHGCGPAFLLSPEQEREIHREYSKLFDLD